MSQKTKRAATPATAHQIHHTSSSYPTATGLSRDRLRMLLGDLLLGLHGPLDMTMRGNLWRVFEVALGSYYESGRPVATGGQNG